jgi:hypothetical protein
MTKNQGTSKTHTSERPYTSPAHSLGSFVVLTSGISGPKGDGGPAPSKA